MRQLGTRRGPICLPLFIPDATRAMVRGVPSGLLPALGIEALQVSTVHLATRPGATVVRAAGGIHAFMGWNGLVVSDSGGFQVFSLLAAKQGLASVSDEGLTYRFSPNRRFQELTARGCIQTQFRLGADILYCLDYCTHPSASSDEQERSVALTLRWAEEGRLEFERQVADVPPEERPLLFAVVQGGPDPKLRARCAEELVAMGFDGLGFGGYPVAAGRLVDEVALVADLVPRGSLLHALGLGSPEHLVTSWRAGYQLFDCTLPTRNARRGVLYTMLDETSLGERGLYRLANLRDERWVREKGPVDPTCDCEMCQTLPAAYVAHLYGVEDTLAGTLGSLHNLRFYIRLVAALREREPR